MELKTKHLTTRALNFNNTILLYGHPVEFIRNLDSLKAAGVWTRFQLVWNKSPGLEVAVSKERNQFRSTDSHRLTAVEKMKALHNRCKDDDEPTGREDPAEIGLYGLPTTIYIFKSYIMKDKTSLLDNVS